MTAAARPRTGVGASALAALGSVLNPGSGHLAVRTRVLRSTFVASVLNLIATVAAIVILGPVRSQADLIEIIADRKVPAETWLEVHREAHGQGMRTNATLLFGHFETPEEPLVGIQLAEAAIDEHRPRAVLHRLRLTPACSTFWTRMSCSPETPSG